MARRSARAIALREIRLRLEHRFDRSAEEPRNPEGERQARVVSARLDGDDALARDAEEVGELRLRPESLGAEDLDPVPNAPL
jgi:hypothetical protein